MALFEVEFVTGRAAQTVEAEQYERQGLHWVFLASRLVMNRPRSVVALRLVASEVGVIRQVGAPAS